MARDAGIEIQKLATVTSSTQQVATFEGGIQTLVLTTDQDVYMNFGDQPADSSSFLVKGGVTHNPWEFKGSNPTKINVKAVSSSANVYLMGLRG